MNNYNPMNMPNNQGGMFSNPTNVMSAPATSSMALPQRMQDALDLVAYEKKLKEFREDNGGNSQDAPPMSKEMVAFFDNETNTERAVRMDNFQNMFKSLAEAGMFGLPGQIGSLAVSAAAPVVSGQTDYSTRSPAAYRQQVSESGWGGFTNSEGNAPGASPGQVGDTTFSGEVGYDQ